MTEAAHCWTWKLADGTASNNCEAYFSRLAYSAGRCNFSLATLGEVGGQAIVHMHSRSASDDAPHLLIASGFHGEEPAGPWGLLAWLETVPLASLAQVNLSLLPLVNVAGFRLGRRLNDEGLNPNRGYLPGNDPLSAEGGVLMQHADDLAQAGRDGFLACHEDVDMSEAYLYAQENGDVPGEFSRALIAANARRFAVVPDGEIYDCQVRDGIILNHQDTSFEAWMMSRGALRAACVETPGAQSIDARIAAQREMIEAFVDFSIRNPR